MDLTLLIVGLVFFGLIGMVTVAHMTDSDISQIGGMQSKSKSSSKKSGKIIFLAFLFLAISLATYITNKIA